MSKIDAIRPECHVAAHKVSYCRFLNSRCCPPSNRKSITISFVSAYSVDTFILIEVYRGIHSFVGNLFEFKSA